MLSVSQSIRLLSVYYLLLIDVESRKKKTLCPPINEKIFIKRGVPEDKILDLDVDTSGTGQCSPSLTAFCPDI